MFNLSPVPAFPQYMGPYKVGTVDIEVPLTELDPEASSPNPDVTTLSVRIFYPCQDPVRTPPKTYWYPQPQSEYFAAYLEFLGTSSKLASFISVFPRMLYNIQIPVNQNTPLLSATTSTGRWPTMIFSHGLGGTRNMYSHICGSLASHGVVVSHSFHAVITAGAVPFGLTRGSPFASLTDTSLAVDQCLSKYLYEQELTNMAQVFAPEHRDGSAPISFVRDAQGKVAHTVNYETIAHDDCSSTQQARNKQLRQRLWEMGETYILAQAIDKGVAFSNHALSSEGKKGDLHTDLSRFKDALNVQVPGAVHFAGHSFGAVTALQYVKSVFYDPVNAPSSYKPLYVPSRDSQIVRQITSNTNLTLLDCWMLPTLDPTTRWLHDRPIPAYSQGGPGGDVILAILSEGFYRWNDNLMEHKRAVSPDPSLQPSAWTAERLSEIVAPHVFYPVKSAHLSQSDFGVLFPWLAKRAFKAEDADRTVRLNARAILEIWRNNGAELSNTSEADMEIVHAAPVKPKEKAIQKQHRLPRRSSSSSTLAPGMSIFKQDAKILLRDGSVRGWVALDLGQEDTEPKDGLSSLISSKDPGRRLKEEA